MTDYRYFTGVGLRHRGQPFRSGQFDGVELKSEDYDDDEQFCQAIASELLEIIKEDREYRESEGNDDAD